MTIATCQLLPAALSNTTLSLFKGRRKALGQTIKLGFSLQDLSHSQS